LIVEWRAAILLADAARVESLLRLFHDRVRQADGRGDQPIHHAARNGDAAAGREAHYVPVRETDSSISQKRTALSAPFPVQFG